MSHLAQVKCKVTDQDLIVRTLRERFNYQVSTWDGQDERTLIILYRISEKPKCQVVATRSNFSSCEAIGFRLNPQTGNYDLIYDEDDRYNGRVDEFLRTFETEYAVSHALQVAEQNGWTNASIEQTENGGYRLVMVGASSY